ncbi:hypothetical protein COV20_00050 [Candidatus Woesearchaeota archaeon CG10_big_fil_rev_8_21_14_0_10_45_16]|nr:MAG: hypothetical protein COV20_00050 [Candidatus Woesearchaeota archaeon CG10_big_fil_rev_8_21_14_0_10_45_16]
MRIMIDTTQDSHDDIRKAIQLLTHFVGETIQHNIPTTPVDTTSMMSMFDAAPEIKKEIPNTAPDFSSFLNLAQKKDTDEKKNYPRVEMY